MGLIGSAACVDCADFESRGAEMRAQISPPGAPIEQVIGVGVSEIRNLGFRSVGFGISGSDLRWHVRGVRLVESAGGGRLLYDIPVEIPGANPNEAAWGRVTDTDPAVGTWGHFLALLESNGVVVEITTDVVGMETIRRAIRGPNATDWYTAPCPSD